MKGSEKPYTCHIAPPPSSRVEKVLSWVLENWENGYTWGGGLSGDGCCFKFKKSLLLFLSC